MRDNDSRAHTVRIYRQRRLTATVWSCRGQELVADTEKLKPATEEVKSLAGPVLAYLAAFTEAPARSLEERLEKLQKSAES